MTSPARQNQREIAMLDRQTLRSFEPQDSTNSRFSRQGLSTIVSSALERRAEQINLVKVENAGANAIAPATI